MRLKTTFLKFALPVILLTFTLIQQGLAQVTYTSKNTSTANGAVGTVQVTDVSNNGAIVNRLLGDETPINFPMIGISETVATPTLKADGSYDIVYTFLIQNYGAINLKTVNAVNDITTVFASPLTYTVTSLTSNSGTLIANTGFNGNGDKNLLVAASSSLATGTSGTLTLTLNVVPNAQYGTFNSTSTTSAVTNDADAVSVADASTNNASPNHSDGTKTPLNFTDPTPVTLNASDIQITKTASTSTPNEGDNVTFTITAQNLGPGDAAPVVVNDALNTTGFTLVSATPSQGTYDSGTGIWSVGTIATSGQATLTVVATVLPNKAAGVYTNTVSSNHPGDPVSTNNSATVMLTPQPVADLSITNTDAQTTYTPGINNTYTVVAANNGASNAAGSAITYTLPTGISGTWTAVYTGGATGNASGTNNINEIVNLPTGSTITYTIVTTIPSSQTGNFTTVATVASPTGVNDLVPGNNSATDTDTKLGNADLAITNTDGQTLYTPGVSNTYTIVATNTGISDVTNASITYPLPSGVSSTWAAVYTGGATGTAGGTNSINELVSMPVGSTITYTVIAAISSSVNGNLTTVATITPPSDTVDPTTGNNSASDVDTQHSVADLSITNTDGQITYTPGTTSTYTVVAANAGPSDAPGSAVTYAIPSGTTATWTAVYAGGATGTGSGAGNINETANITSGGTAIYTVVLTIPSSQTGTITTTATVAAATGITDATAGNDTAVDTDNRNSVADLSITNTDGKATYTPGTTNTYTVVASNNGPSNAPGTTVTFNLPAGTSSTWTSVAAGGATGSTAVGNNNINETVNLPAGSSITYTIIAAVASDLTGTLPTVATISPANTINDPDTGNNTEIDTDTQNSKADLSITNTDGQTTYTPGATSTYTVVATNSGPSDAPGSTVTYAIPAGTTATWTVIYAGGATGNASGSNNINETVNMPSGSTATYTVVVTIPSDEAGTFTTTASIIASNDVTDATTGNNTATDADNQNNIADLSITNTDGKTTYTPGTTNTYTVVATNNGPSDAPGTTITYTLPLGITSTWTAVYAGGAIGNNSGTNDISESVFMPAGSTVTYTVIASIPANQTGTFTTTAVVTAGTGVTDATTANNTAIDIDNQNSQADLSITNTDGQTTYTPGTTNTYTVVATNNGASDAPGSTITYPMPTGITGTWTAVYTGGATGTTSGTGSINETADMPAGSAVTYTITANIASNLTGVLTTTATVTAAAGVTDATTGNNTASDVDIRNSQADLSITNTDSKTTYTPGVNNTYTVVATNNGPSDAPGSTVTYTLPSGITGTWTAAYAGGATGNASGTNNINETVNMPSGSTVTYTVIASIPANQTGTFTTTTTVATAAGITDATAGNNTAVDTDTQNSIADLSIINTDGQTTYTPGTTNTYTVVATNNGTSDALGSTITFPMPTGVTGTWTATYTGSATGNTSGTGGINETVGMPAGSTVTYTITANIASNVTGALTTTAMVATAVGITDPTPGNNTASDTDTQNSQADLSITNTDGQATYTPGTSNTYTVVATNNGASDAPGSTITYPMPTGLTGTWTAAYTGSATGNASGTGNINETVDMPAGSTVTYTITANIASNVTGPLTTTATITAATGVTDATPGNNIALDIDTRNSQADLSITNTDGKAIYVPGITNTYTVVATNAGPSDGLGSAVTYTLPSGITGTWTAVYTGGATGNASGSNNINEVVDMPSGSTVTYTVVVPVPSGQTGALFTTTATISPSSTVTDASTANNTAIDNDVRIGDADVSITNTDGQTTYTPGTTNTYTLVATNNGPSDVSNTTVAYPLPTGVTTTWTAVFTGGATGNASGTNSINETVIMPSGSTITYTVTAGVSSAQTGSLTTTASISLPAGSVDLTPANNTATDVDTQNSQADLSITNTDGQATYTPGVNNTYTVVSTNNGVSDAPGSTVTYTLPSGITGTWSAVYTGGATGTTSGTNNINETVNMPSGSTVTYIVIASIPASQTGTFTTTATVATASGITDATAGNNTATDVDVRNSQADLSITNTDGQATYTPGINNTYTVVATNNGPSDAPGSTVTYTLPSGITGTWTAVYTGGATGNTSGSNNINEAVDMPSGSTVTYTVIASISANQTGTLTTTATIATGTGITDATSGNNTATDVDNQNSQADLSITNTDGQTTYTPGTTNTYTVVATNNGPSDAQGSTITYPMPTGLAGTWTAAYTGGATGNASGIGSINETVDMPAGSTVTYTVTANIASNVTGPLTTTATVTVAAGVTDATAGNNISIDIDTRNSQADLSITNTDSKAIYVPGTINTYTVVAANSGPSDALGSTVTYTLPSGITGTWTAVYTGGATGNASGTNDINETVDMPLGSTITYTVVVPVPSGQTGALFTTTATISASATVTDASTANNTAIDNDVRIGGADLSITNTDGQINYTPGVGNTYTVVATNNGPSDVNNAGITYTIPAGTTATWTAVYTGGATGNASGTNNINKIVNMPLGSTITYTVVVAIPSAQIGTLTTTAAISLPIGSVDPTPANNNATDVDIQNSQADLSITNTDGQINYTPGVSNTYTVVATNAGPSDAPGTSIAYTLPAGVTGTWSAVYTGGASGNTNGANNINETVSMPAGSTITYTVIASIPSSQTGVVNTTATITPVSSVTDAATGNNTANDTDLRNSQADLSITNTDNTLIYTPGTTNTYTVVATNSGPSDALGSAVTYTIPSGSTATWTATYTGGAAGSANGTNNINETVDLPSGSTVTYTVVVSVPSNQTGIFSTAANIAPAASVTDATTGNNNATDNDGRISAVDLAITNTDGKLTYIPGTTNTYTVVATNNGPSDALGATVAYTLPAGINGTWTAAYTGGATGNSSGTNNIGETVNMPVGSTITYTVIATIPSTQAGSFTTTATITSPTILADLVPGNNTATDADLKNSVIDLKIVKTASNTTPSINTQVTFTLAVGNNGPSEATNVTVADLLPSGFTYISSVPSTGTYSSSTGVWTIGNLDITDNPTITIMASVNGTGNYTNIASVSGAETDSNPANNTSQVTIIAKQLPVANNDAAATNPNTAVTMNILVNDVPAETALVPASVTIITPTQHGTVTIDPATGNATYTPATGYYGTDTFTYTVMDANGGTSNVATVTITINKPPVANNDSALTIENVSVDINLLVNDVKGDANLAPATVQVVQQPLHGTVTLDPSTGIAIYQPGLGYYGADNFTYTVKDQNGAISNVANVAIVVLKPITAVDDNATTNPNTAVTINILNNDIPGDAAIDATTVAIIQQPANGKVVINATTGVAVYTPITNYFGDDEFTYTVKDQKGFTSNIATVTIKINDVPVIGLAKASAPVVKALNGSYNVTYLLTVGNYGLADLSSISITDDISQTFRGETWKATGIKPLGNLTVNPNYDGQAIIEMLQGTNTLKVGQIEQIQVTVNVTTVDATTTFLNRAYAAGTSVTGLKTTDQSTDGYRADPNKGGDVSPSDPTPVELPKPCIRIPAGFSPNSDGVHDNWVIEGTCIVGGVSMEIYNRWGNLVYKDAHYKNDWNGKCNQGIHIGEDLPVGTYYYIVNVSGNDKYVGYLTLNR